MNNTIPIPFFSIVSGPNSSIETQNIIFSILFNATNEGQYSDVGLDYNASLRELTRTTVGSQVWYNVSFSTPGVNQLVENVSYRWNWTIGGVQQHGRYYNNTVSKLNLVSCRPEHSAGNLTINFSIFNEATPTERFNASAETQILVYTGAKSDSITFNFEEDTPLHQHLFCLNPANQSVHMDAEFKYTVSGGFTHFYYVVNDTISNSSVQKYSTYNFNITSGISDLVGVVRSPTSFSEVQDVITELQREYLGEGTHRIVQMDRTGEFGQLFFNIVEETTAYRMLFYNATNYQLLKTVENLKFKCTDGLCEFTFLVTPGSPEVPEELLGVNYAFDNSTNILTVSWNDPNEVVEQVRVTVTKELFQSTTEICNDTYSGSTGTATCDVTGFAPPYRLQVFSSSSPEKFNLNVAFGQIIPNTIDVFGGQAVSGFYAFLVVTSLGLAGAMGGIVTAGALMLVGLTISSLLGWVSFLEMGIIMGLAIVTLMIADRVNKSRGGEDVRRGQIKPRELALSFGAFLLVIGFVAYFVSALQAQNPAGIDQERLAAFNESFNRVAEYNQEAERLQTDVEGVLGQEGGFGFLNSLINQAWNTLRTLGDTLSFVFDVIEGLGEVFGVPTFIVQILVSIATLIIVFGVLTVIFNRDI